MAKKILVRHGVVKKMAEALKFNRTTVTYALAGLDDTENQRLIREEAIKNYGGVYVR